VVPVPFALLFGVALGSALAWIAAPELGSSDVPIVASRPFAIVVAFALLVWIPVVGYFVAFHGDWSYVYLVPWHRVPGAVDLALVILAGAAVVGGFCAAVGPVRRRSLTPVALLTAVPTGVAVAAMIMAARRLAVSGTYVQLHGDFGTEPIGTSLLGRGVLLMGLVLVVGVGWTVRALVRAAGD
jgi:hypothetical protein